MIKWVCQYALISVDPFGLQAVETTILEWNAVKQIQLENTISIEFYRYLINHIINIIIYM